MLSDSTDAAGLGDDPALDEAHLVWAVRPIRGPKHYHRLQGPRLLAQRDNTPVRANDAHSVRRDPTSDFGLDVLGAHRARHHA